MSWRAYGQGAPVTLVVPGLAATTGEARIPASGLPGTRVVLTFPSHGDEPDAPGSYWQYSTIAEDVLRVADEVKAQGAIGVSLGAGALTRIAAEHPDRFGKIALLLPAVLDRPRRKDVREQLRKTEPDDIARTLPAGYALGDYVEARSKALKRLPQAIDQLADAYPIEDRRALKAVSAEVVVIAATGDPLHPGEIARETAEAFKEARLEIFDSPAPMITHRSRLRAILQELFG